MTVFLCRDDFESMLTCIFDAWASGLGHDNVALQLEPLGQMDLLTEYIHVESDSLKAERVRNSIIRKISQAAYMWVYYASLSAEPDALDTIYRFLVLGFKVGAHVMSMLQEAAVMRMMELRRQVGNEAHLFREFIRFTSHNNILYTAHFEPKSNCILLVSQHFADRMISEYWMIIDDARGIAAVHNPNEQCYFRQLTDAELNTLSATEDIYDEFTMLWQEYFKTIAIKERENPTCQMNHFPKWMRKHATEFINN